MNLKATLLDGWLLKHFYVMKDLALSSAACLRSMMMIVPLPLSLVFLQPSSQRCQILKWCLLRLLPSGCPDPANSTSEQSGRVQQVAGLAAYHGIVRC